LEKVRPGGLVAFITSRGTMDKIDNTLRKHIADRADLIGAIRLPNTAFKRNANTEVTADVIILKKRGSKEATRGASWIKVIPYTTTKGEVISINEYFVENPHMMLGEMRLEGGCMRATSQRLSVTAGTSRPHWPKPSSICRKTFTKPSSVPRLNRARAGHPRARPRQTQRLHGSR
jgi:hypothetical protein